MRRSFHQKACPFHAVSRFVSQFRSFEPSHTRARGAQPINGDYLPSECASFSRGRMAGYLVGFLVCG